VRNIESIERAHEISAVVLDKTGTLTEGPLGRQVVPFNGNDEELRPAHDRIRRTCIGASSRQGNRRSGSAPGHHAAGRRVVASTTGGGVAGEVEGHAVIAGTAAFLRQHAIEVDVPPLLTSEDEGDTVVFVGIDGRPAAPLPLPTA